MSLEIKGAILGLIAGLGVLGATFGLSPVFQPKKVLETKREQFDPPVSLTTNAALTGEANRGIWLFDHNCTHCHGEDARGDEGPSLYNLSKSDARLRTIIKGGIKGEMPSFVKKFDDGDIQALIAYLRTLKD